MTTLSEINGTTWAGDAELWLDPAGDSVVRSECTFSVEDTVLSYTWSHEGKDHKGTVTLSEESAEFVDTFHSAEPMTLKRLSNSWGFFQLEGNYGPDKDWGWRIGLSLRTPTGQLVLQMTNIAPWGEEARAVRMAGTRQ